MKISVITAVFNNRDTILDCLASVREQTYHDIQHVVIDGASTDGTSDLLHQHRARIDVLVCEPDRGIYDALNKGIVHCSGDVIGFMHADDMYADNQVLGRIALAFANPEVGAAFGDLQYVNKEDPSRVFRYWRAGEFSPARLARGWMPPHPTLYVRRDIYARLGGFDTAFKIAADYDYVLRLFSSPSLNSVYVPDVLVKMRVGGTSNRSLLNILRKCREDLKALRKNQVGGVSALVWKNLSKLGQFWVVPN